jgi:FkbM family methyltransferase
MLNPFYAERFAKLVGYGRQVVATNRGKFFVDPLSNFGQQLIRSGEYEPGMTKIVDNYLFPGSVFVDLGANEAYFTILASKRCGPMGKVYAIEPQSRCLKVLSENCTLNDCTNVTILPLAISDYCGRLTLNLHPLTNTGATSILQPTRYKVATETVECTTLAELMKAHRIETYDLLKVDIEGGEYQALMGSPEVFQKGLIKVIAVEYHPHTLSRLGLPSHTIDTIHHFLESCGYLLNFHFGYAVYLRRDLVE